MTVVYVFLDFAIDLRPAQIQTSYRLNIGEIPVDQPQWFQQENLYVLVIRRSESLIESLMQSNPDLQDHESKKSNQPAFATNLLRARHADYFVSYAMGTDLGCKLIQVESFMLGEICGDARYDFAGRAISGKNQFQNLLIPDYNFSHDFKSLIIRP